MAQLDKIIQAMLGQPGSEIALVANAEPQLHAPGAPPHVLINRKVAAPLLRQLIGELIGEASVAQLDASDAGEFTYTIDGQPVGVQVRAWKATVDARLRQPSAKRTAGVAAPAAGAALGRIELAKVRARAGDGPQAPAPFGSESGDDDLELDLAPQSSTRSGVAAGPAPAIETRVETKVTAQAGEPPINALFRAMVKQGCSDLHLSAGERPMIRRDGDMGRLDESLSRFKGDQIMDLLRPIMPDRNLEEFESDHDTDFAYEIAGISRFRANVFLDRRGVGAVFRTIPAEVATAEKLGLSSAIQNLCYLTKGLVLVTGPTGSGKSTTLSALVDLINRTRHDHVITIEDPIEFVHQNKSCLINQREVGPHTDSFKRALRAALREDPDVVMVGEMRDLETMAIAMETAETGHLVFGTLHTSTAYSTVDRLIDSFPADRQAQIRVMLSESLKGVISQTLCKKIGGGRIAAHEVLLVSSAIANLIREAKTFQIPTVMQTSRGAGMVMMNDALFELVSKKKVDVKEAYVKSTDKPSFVTQLRAAGHKLEFLGG
jgi:twitching motility protein PilT